MIYSESEDTEAAKEIVKKIIADSRRPATTEGPSDNTLVQVPSVGTIVASKVAHNIAMLFRTEKFTVENGQSWNGYVSEYQQVARDYQLGNQ